MRRLLCVVLVMVLPACPPTVGESCQRVLIDALGNADTSGFGGGPATNNAPPQGFVNTPLSLTFFAPLSSCVSDSLRIDTALTGPDNLPGVVTVVEQPNRTGFSAVKTVVSFTPLSAGLHTLKVAFEPSLGVRTVFIDVAEDGLRGATTRVPIPTCRVNATWPLTDDTVACEEQSSGLISINSADGGVTRFSGVQLVVVDRVLWSIDGPNATLERRVFEDGGVQLTHGFSNFPNTATPAMHDVDLAMRFRSNGRLTRVRLAVDGGTRVEELVLDGQAGPPLAFFNEDNDVVFRWSRFDCSGNNCVNLEDLVAVEPGFVWRSDGGSVSGFTRPTTPTASASVTLPYGHESFVTPGSAFERMPLWLSGFGTQRVLVSRVDGGVSFTSWPRSEVLRVGRNQLVLTDADPGFVRVIKR